MGHGWDCRLGRRVSQCHSSGLIIQDMEVSVGTRYFHPYVNPEPRGCPLLPSGTGCLGRWPSVPDLRGTVCGPHCPLRGGPGSPRCLLPSYQVPALQSSTLGSEEELVDGFTYSTSLDLGQAAYTPGPRSKPGNLPGPSQGCPTRLADRPTPESLKPRSRGHRVPLLAHTPGDWGLSGEPQTSLVLVGPGFPTDYIPATPLSGNLSQLSMRLRSPSAGLPGQA